MPAKKLQNGRCKEIASAIENNSIAARPITDPEAEGLCRRPTVQQMNEAQLREYNFANNFVREPRWGYIDLLEMQKRSSIAK